MEDTQSVVTLIDSTTSKIQQLQHAFSELENHRSVALNLKWKELEAHFHGLERSLKRRFDELEDQEKVFESKASEAQELLEKREAAVVAKEEASLEKLQEKRDAALFAIGDVLKRKHTESVELVINYETQSGDDDMVEEKPPDDNNNVAVISEDVKVFSGNTDTSMGVKPRPELIKLCEEMNSNGLHKFISDNRKNLVVIREEIPLALTAATDPARLVLESLKDFYRMSTADGKKDSNLLGLRRTCIMLMECLGQLLADSKQASAGVAISEDIKKQAKAVADEWKPKLDDLDIDASSGNSLEAHAFLQLLATFGISCEFDQDEIYKLIPTVSRRRQTADLCRALGVSEKMPDVIEVLVNSGKQIDAVNLAYAFGLTEKYSPVPLLKSYLKDARKASSPPKLGNTSPTAQNDVNDRELTALKAIIKCIEEHKLEDLYQLEPLQKRVFQLEKAKADKKRVAEAAKPQSKRPRANGGPRVNTNIPEKSFYNNTVPDRYNPPYMYDNRPYLYPAQPATVTYNISPAHGSYFGNGYAYQAPPPYLH
ncbi:hypothetical protein ACHQM5_014705 [Ranunculus cassubicifolius]